MTAGTPPLPTPPGGGVGGGSRIPQIPMPTGRTEPAGTGARPDPALELDKPAGRMVTVRRDEAVSMRDRLAREWGMDVHVIPCDTEKRPATKDWVNRAGRTAEQIRALWGPRDMAVGVACGKTGVFVLDLDVPLEDVESSPDPGQRELGRLLRQVIELRQTRVLTSSGRGLPHFIWHQTDPPVPQASLWRLQKDGDLGVERSGRSVGDLRSTGGQVVIGGGPPLVDVQVTYCPPEVVAAIMAVAGTARSSGVGTRDGTSVRGMSSEEVDEFVYGTSRELAGGVGEAERSGYLAQLAPSFYKKLTEDGGSHRHDAMYRTMKTAFIEALAGGYPLAGAVDLLESVYKDAYEGGVAGRDVRAWEGDREDDFRGIVRGRAQEAAAGLYDELIVEKRQEKGWFTEQEMEAMLDWAIASMQREDAVEPATGEQPETGPTGPLEPPAGADASAHAEVPADGSGDDPGAAEAAEEPIWYPQQTELTEQAPAEPGTPAAARAELAARLEPGSSEWFRLVEAVMRSMRLAEGVDTVKLAEQVASELAKLQVRELAREGLKVLARAPHVVTEGLDLTEVWAEPRSWMGGLVPAGSVTMLVGASGSFKTMLALLAEIEVLDAGGVVLHLDWEMGRDKLVPRLRALRCDPVAAGSRVVHVWQPGDILADLDRYRGYGADLVIIDSVTRAINASASMTAGGSNDNDAFTAWMQTRVEPLIEAGRAGRLSLDGYGAAVLMIDHVGHEEGTRARGASAKKDAVSQVLSVKKTQNLVPREGLAGMAEITVRKSRLVDLPEDTKRVVELVPSYGRGAGSVDPRTGVGGGELELRAELREMTVADGIRSAVAAEGSGGAAEVLAAGGVDEATVTKVYAAMLSHGAAMNIEEIRSAAGISKPRATAALHILTSRGHVHGVGRKHVATPPAAS